MAHHKRVLPAEHPLIPKHWQPIPKGSPKLHLSRRIHLVEFRSAALEIDAFFNGPNG